MPVRIGKPGRWQRIQPTQEWQVMAADGGPGDIDVEADEYYVEVIKR